MSTNQERELSPLTNEEKEVREFFLKIREIAKKAAMMRDLHSLIKGLDVFTQPEEEEFFLRQIAGSFIREEPLSPEAQQKLTQLIERVKESLVEKLMPDYPNKWVWKLVDYLESTYPKESFNENLPK